MKNEIMKNHKILILFFIVLITGQSVSFSQEIETTKVLNQFHKITSEEMMTWMEKLCSPEFNGRLTGTPGYIASAEWVAGMLIEWGIRPGGDNGTFLQWFNHPFNVVNDIGSLSLKIPQPYGSSITKYYDYPVEYYPGMNSGNGEITAEVEFAGYGVSAPELGYDDYRDIDVKGKIVLVNRDVPHTNPGDREYSKWVRYCYHQYKLQNAVKHGASGFLYVDGIGANPNISYDPSILVCGIGEGPLNDIFAGLIAGCMSKIFEVE
jgi:hypothetical protein